MKLATPLRHCLCFAPLLASCSSEPAFDPAAEWRQFRGNDQTAISPAAGLPAHWGPKSPNLRWRATLPGHGNSSPVVSGGRVFLTTAYTEDRTFAKERGVPHHRVALALDFDSGEILWETTVFSAPSERRHYLNTPAAPTPVADGRVLYVYFGFGLAALDYDGEILWRREVDPRYHEESRYGAVSSPVLSGRAVIVARDDEWGEGEHRSWIAAFDRRSGEELWREERFDTCCSYATPLVVPHGGADQIVFPTSPYVLALDARSGERLWTFGHELSQVVPSMTAAGDRLVVPGSIHRRALHLLRYPPEADEPEELWSERRGAPESSTPVLWGDLLFATTDNGILQALDAATGTLLWRTRLPAGNYRASLVAGDGKLYATSADCVISVFAAEAEMRPIAANELGGRCDATPAIAAGDLVVRTRGGAVRIGRESDELREKLERKGKRRRRGRRRVAKPGG